MKPIRIMIVDDHAIVADGLRRVIGMDRRLQVVGTAKTLAEAFALVVQVHPDLILLDLRLPDSTGMDTIEGMKKACGDAHIIVLTGFPNMQQAETAGVDAYIDKQTASDDLLATIRKLFGMSADEAHMPVTSREMQVAQLAAEGLSNSEIARKLFISQNTVKTHLAQIFAKFNVRDRVDLARRWDTLRETQSGEDHSTE